MARFQQYYEVGHGRPPKATRWQKGQSGNPAGRPPKRASFTDELRAVLGETIDITMGGEPQRVSIQKGLMLKLRALALQGEVWAQKLLAEVQERTPEPILPYQAELDAYVRELDQQDLAARISRVGRLNAKGPSDE